VQDPTVTFYEKFSSIDRITFSILAIQPKALALRQVPFHRLQLISHIHPPSRLQSKILSPTTSRKLTFGKTAPTRGHWWAGLQVLHPSIRRIPDQA